MVQTGMRVGLIVVLLLGMSTASSAMTARPIEDWYDPSIPLFASDLIADPARSRVYVADQITGQIFALAAGETAAEPLDVTGFSPTRDEVMSLVARKAEWDGFLSGEILLEWDTGHLLMYDGRKSFGSDRWIEIDPEPGDARLVDASRRDSVSPPRGRDPALLADAVAELAGRGRRVRPWRWSIRNDALQLIDQMGRSYLFAVERGGFGQKRLRLIAELDSLFSRLSNLTRAELQVEDPNTLRLKIGSHRWRAEILDDPYTGDRGLDLQPDTNEAPFLRPAAPKKGSRPSLPPNWSDFFQQTKILAEGPAGQLIHAKIRFTNSGLKAMLILSQGGRILMFPWDGQDLQPDEIVTVPEGFVVRAPPAWKLVGWTPEFNGWLSIGNSHFQRLAPIVTSSSVDAAPATAGLFVLDAAERTVSEWPIVEWPRYSAVYEFHMTAEPLDLTVSKTGEVFVLARDPERGHRIFRLSEAPEPILDLPEEMIPEFLPANVPTFRSKTEIRQLIWTMAGQPPALVRKHQLDLHWQMGHGIAWKYEPDGVILFSTDPAGENDMAVTVQIEGIGRVRQAVQVAEAVWILETDSGIHRLDARDPTAPEISPVEEEGGNLRATLEGAVYTVPDAGAARAMHIGSDGQKKSMGLFAESWTAMGADGDRLFFKDRAASKIYIVHTGSPPEREESGQMTGSLDFNYDDPTTVLLCALGGQAHCMLVRPKAPSFLLGPMPYGAYRLDASAGLYDFAGPVVFSMTEPEITLPDMRLTKTLDFIYRRALNFEESKNLELAKFNYELYLSLYPQGRSKNMARSALLIQYAADERWDEMTEFYRKSPLETNWSPEALRILLDRLPRLVDRLDVARKWATSAQDVQKALLLFFLYKHSLDPAFASAVHTGGIPAVYKRFFESFDRTRP